MELPAPDEPTRQVVDSDDNAPAWTELAEYGPGVVNVVEDPDDLGNRKLYRSAVWAEHVSRYSTVGNDYWDNAKENYPAPQELAVQGSYRSLHRKQKLFHDTVLKHCMLSTNSSLATQDCPPQLLLHLDGQGGSGKSYVILLLSQSLASAASPGPNPIIIPTPIIRSAPTGVAAHGISGVTLHSLFRLAIHGKHESLSAYGLLEATWPD